MLFYTVRCLLVCSIISLLLGCASFKNLVKFGGESSVSSQEEVVYSEENLPPESSEMPLVINQQVLRWMDYYLGRGRKHMARYLRRLPRYKTLMQDILAEHGLPKELIYVPLIESGFSPTAHSHASAVGYWQFISDTGRRFGLEINTYVDERRDPVLSTVAAINYYKNLYSRFGNWYLALASYNTGENRVGRAVRKHGSRDFWRLSARKALPRETRNYVPKFLAALHIAKRPELYGFKNINHHDPLVFDTVKVDRSISLVELSKALKMEFKEISRLNPVYRSDFVPVPKSEKVEIRVPKGRLGEAVRKLASCCDAKKPKLSLAGVFNYKVRRGDTLSQIARRHGMRLSHLRRMNRGRLGRFLRIGQRLKIPERGVRIRGVHHLTKISEYKKPSRIKKSRKRRTVIYHKVRRGESLSRVAKKYGTTVRRLKKLNGLRSNVLRIGQKLRLRARNSSGQAKAKKPRYHKVHRGDTLSGISERYQIPIATLRSLNGLENGSIQIGQKLKLQQSSTRKVKSPGRNLGSADARIYKIRKGDTLIAISRKLGVTTQSLMKTNSITRRSVLRIGQSLRIPK